MWMDNFYYKKPYIDLLQDISAHQEKNKYTDNKPRMLIFKHNNYGKFKADDVAQDLISAGYLMKPEKDNSKIFITDEGKAFLQSYYQFKIKGWLAKFSELFKMNFIPIVSIFTLTLAVISIMIQCF